MTTTRSLLIVEEKFPSKEPAVRWAKDLLNGVSQASSINSRAASIVRNCMDRAVDKGREVNL